MDLDVKNSDAFMLLRSVTGWRRKKKESSNLHLFPSRVRSVHFDARDVSPKSQKGNSGEGKSIHLLLMKFTSLDLFFSLSFSISEN